MSSSTPIGTPVQGGAVVPAMMSISEEKLADMANEIERLRAALQRFMRMVEGDTAPVIVESCMNQARKALESSDD